MPCVGAGRGEGVTLHGGHRCGGSSMMMKMKKKKMVMKPPWWLLVQGLQTEVVSVAETKHRQMWMKTNENPSHLPETMT